MHALLLAAHLALSTPAQAADWPDLAQQVVQTNEGRNDAAVIVAIEDYTSVDDVLGARANAEAWLRWFVAGRGIPAARVFKAFDAEAKDIQIRALALQAAAAVQAGGTLWFVYVGHGAPSVDGRDGLLVGVDADRSAQGIYQRSVPRQELMRLLGAGPQAQTVALLDACFSGQTGDGTALVAGLQPMVPTALLSGASSRARVLTAAGSGEFSGPLAGTARPAFSYLALGALMGWADAAGSGAAGNGDGRVSASELRDYVQGALNLTVSGRSQTPMLLGEDGDLSRAATQAAPDLFAIVQRPKAANVEVDAGGASLETTTDLAALAAKAQAATQAREQAEREAAEAAERAAAAAVAEVETVKTKLAGAKTPAQNSSGNAGSGRDWVSPTLGTMKWIPAGTFTMGSPTSEPGRDSDERQHRVTLTKGYWIMEHEVTQGEWQAVMGGNPSGFDSCGTTCPVETVSWDDAVEFARLVSARDGVTYALPTEAQWEYAARGGGSGRYAGGDELGAVAWTGEYSGGRTHPVCQKARNGYGLCDMSGNVWEWTADVYGDYPAGSVSDPSGPASDPGRVARGGSWGFTAGGARVAFRGGLDLDYRGDGLGLRLSRTNP